MVIAFLDQVFSTEGVTCKQNFLLIEIHIVVNLVAISYIYCPCVYFFPFFVCHSQSFVWCSRFSNLQKITLSSISNLHNLCISYAVVQCHNQLCVASLCILLLFLCMTFRFPEACQTIEFMRIIACLLSFCLACCQFPHMCWIPPDLPISLVHQMRCFVCLSALMYFVHHMFVLVAFLLNINPGLWVYRTPKDACGIPVQSECEIA